MSEQKIYARVVDGKVAEYPVFELHITNRAHPLSWYTQVDFDDKPEVGEFFDLQETLKVKNGKVMALYSVHPQSLSTVLNKIHTSAASTEPGAQQQSQVPVVFAEIPVAAVQRVFELTRELVQARLDAFAAEKNYDGILSAVGYATSSNSVFAAEGQRAADVRDASWQALYLYFDEVQAGTKPVPKTLVEIEAVLPTLVWS